MKKIVILTILVVFSSIKSFAENDTIKVVNLNEVSIVSTYRNNISIGSELKSKNLKEINFGQEPCFAFRTIPSVFSYCDNGSDFGYGYMRIRGLDQTRINVTLDGMPWNEAEDFGCYFANSPDIMSSMHSIKVENGASVTANGTSAYAGNISLESVDLKSDTISSVYFGYGSFNSRKTSIVYNSGINENGEGIHIKYSLTGSDGFKYHSSNNSKSFTVKIGNYLNSNNYVEFLSINGKHENGQGYIGVYKDELDIDNRINGCSVYDNDEFLQSVNKLQYKGFYKNNACFIMSLYNMYQDGSYRFDLDNYMKKVINGAYSDVTGKIYDYALTQNMTGGNFVLKHYGTYFNFDLGGNAYKYSRRHFLGKNGVNMDEFDNYDNFGYKNDMNLFGKLKFESDKISVITKIQYRYVDFKYKDFLNPHLSFDKYKNNSYWNFINSEIDFNYNISNKINTYARIAVTNREPTRTDMFGGNEWYTGELMTLKPENVHDYECGINYTDKKINFNFNAYYMSFINELVLNGMFNVNGLPLHENVDNSYRFGGEFSGNYIINNNFSTSLNASLSKNTMISEAYGNKTHTFSPSSTISADIKYHDSKNIATVCIVYRSKMYVDMMNIYYLEPSFSLNLSASRTVGNITFGLKANNLTNRLNASNASIGYNGILYLIDAPFNVFAFAEYNF